MALNACGNKSIDTYREQVLDNYLNLVDSSGKFDTNDINFKLLKAYSQNDSAQLKVIDSFLEKQRSATRPSWDLWLKDIPLPSLETLKANRAYRFIFSMSNSSVHEAITISSTDSNYQLQYASFQKEESSNAYNIINTFQRQITFNDWIQFKNKFDEVDFWGLKNENYHRGDDGSDLTILGFEDFGDNNSRSQYVHRWSSPNLAPVFHHIYTSMLNKEERLY